MQPAAGAAAPAAQQGPKIGSLHPDPGQAGMIRALCEPAAAGAAGQGTQAHAEVDVTEGARGGSGLQAGRSGLAQQQVAAERDELQAASVDAGHAREVSPLSRHAADQQIRVLRVMLES